MPVLKRFPIPTCLVSDKPKSKKLYVVASAGFEEMSYFFSTVATGGFA